MHSHAIRSNWSCGKLSMCKLSEYMFKDLWKCNLLFGACSITPCETSVYLAAITCVFCGAHCQKRREQPQCLDRRQPWMLRTHNGDRRNRPGEPLAAHQERGAAEHRLSVEFDQLSASECRLANHLETVIHSKHCLHRSRTESLVELLASGLSMWSGRSQK